ncbi:ParB/RepB/Spo0J family partition protein [Rhizobium wenxiniae]|uniref:ParB/RepB/Spo0J family partition protein n=1 Tax=Rhizobium wenxiniae TaxID=1737357 RepID=UPI003C213278
MTEIVTIALSKLDADPKNVRKTYTADSVEALAASILANGVLQNIVGRKATKGRYLVSAGGRRLAALKLLAERGDIAKDYGVDVRVREADDATEISLTENVMREAMHPADQYEAFKALVDEGKSVKDVAARFGTTEVIVNRRLALAKVSPVLLALYRSDEMDFDQLAAFTISDDHARQVEVWESLSSWDRSAHTIKRRLTSEEVPASDKRLTFVGGLEAYEAAGGTVRRDLFDEKGGFASDSGFLERLVAEKLNEAVGTIEAEGWKWVECGAQQPDDLYRLERVYPQRLEISDEDQAKLDQLTVRYDELATAIDEGAGDEAEAELAEVERQIEALQNVGEEFRGEDIAKAGAFATLDYYGKLQIIRGLVRDGDASSTVEEGGEPGGAGDGDTSEKTPTLSHPASLIEDLTAQKTAALRVELANNADIALVAVVHALLLGCEYRGTYGAAGGHSALEITLTHERLEGAMKRPESCKALEAWEALKENYGDKLPGNPADLWEWLLDQSREELLHLLAYAAGHSVNAVETKHGGIRKEAIEHAHHLGQTMRVDMKGWFETTAESYFTSLNRTSIELAVADVRGIDFAKGISAMKKAEAASYAENAIKGYGWLPQHIRIAAEPGDETFPMAAE